MFFNTLIYFDNTQILWLVLCHWILCHFVLCQPSFNWVEWHEIQKNRIALTILTHTTLTTQIYFENTLTSGLCHWYSWNGNACRGITEILRLEHSTLTKSEILWQYFDVLWPILTGRSQCGCKLSDRRRHWNLLGERWDAGTALDPSAYEERHGREVRRGAAAQWSLLSPQSHLLWGFIVKRKKTLLFDLYITKENLI